MNTKVSNIKHEGDIYKMTLSGLNVSIANSIRRVIISELPVCVIRTENEKVNQCHIETNTSRLHNEILKHRLSCIPIILKYEDIDTLPGKYELVVEVSNTTDTVMFVTTEDFKLRNKNTGNFCTKEQTNKIFPPNIKTNYYIDFMRLRPKISDNIPGEEIKLVADFSISDGLTNSSFNAVSKCSYMFTPDVIGAKEVWEGILVKKRSDNISESDIAFDKRNFDILDSQRIFIEDSFDFIIQGIGMYENAEMIRLACHILQRKFRGLIEKLESDSVSILNSETTMSNCFDVILENEDYTVGKVIEFLIYDEFFQREKTLSFCGFKKFHPHDTKSTIRMAFNDVTERSIASSYMKTACETAITIFGNIGKMF